MTPFTKQVIAIIAAIPEGKVMTYGQIAAHAGSPRAARNVCPGTVLSMQKAKSPYQMNTRA